MTACIKRQDGYCCIQYQVCNNVINGFSLSSQSQVTANAGDTDTQCTLDYVTIPGKNTLAIYKSCDVNFFLNRETLHPVILLERYLY